MDGKKTKAGEYREGGEGGRRKKGRKEKKGEGTRRNDGEIKGRWRKNDTKKQERKKNE